jgi:hypothetical protein
MYYNDVLVHYSYRCRERIWQFDKEMDIYEGCVKSEVKCKFVIFGPFPFSRGSSLAGLDFPMRCYALCEV